MRSIRSTKEWTSSGPCRRFKARNETSRSVLDLDIEYSRQTPNMGYHVESTNGDGGLVQATLEATTNDNRLIYLISSHQLFCQITSQRFPSSGYPISNTKPNPKFISLVSFLYV